ncbi:uncharacterized protein LOC110979686 [Acanthaster planci]|uniref:non-specific serine/threonine protein kinase n=1 Tax=Acanthaster planci TaxID=133434 RepID=A0A8B7YFM3_ACAPL|nr:uncharacterized protein LOC110979686 [Acanthaster planci]XP_022091397.1 uncharacterized protein LOC110979686 [Acanthaster planci]
MKADNHLPKLPLAGLLLLAVCRLTDAASLAEDTEDGMDLTSLSDATVIGILTVASCLCLITALIGCASCCKRGFHKFEETTTETNVVGQHYTSFSDFSPPTMSTPSRPPGSPEPETVTIEPLPQLPGRTSNQWVNVLRVSGGGSSAGLDPGQTLQSIKLIDSPRFQFPRCQVSYVDEMGNGWFGKVLQGEAQRMHPGLRKTRVVIKQLRDTATPEEQLLFLQEVQPYREVNHPNVLLLLGQCIDSMPLLLILEYAPFGDLKSYLWKHRGEVQQMAQQDIQLKMAADMVSGLMWLHQADFIYIDLATRNCQVCADTSVKIGDYGLALEKYPDDYYITRDNSQAIPIRWLGPEVIDLKDDGSVKTKKVTKESNVWSFGIMMLELSTGAKRPYAKLTDEQVLQQVVKEQEIRVDKPNLKIHYASRWFEIMMYCWLEADIRPSMKELHDLIMYLKNNRDRVDMPDFEARWNTLKPAALQESSESSKEDEGEPPLPIQKNPPAGFEDDFVPPGETKKTSPAKQEPPAVIVPPPAKSELPDKTVGFESDFGAAPVAFIKSAPEEDISAPSPNRNMNAETTAPDDQPRFDDDFVTAIAQPNVEAVPQAARSDALVDGLQPDFVTQVEMPVTHSNPLFPEQDDGQNIMDKNSEQAPKSNIIPTLVGTDKSSPGTPHRSPEKVVDTNLSSTPVVSEELFEPPANTSTLTPAGYDGPNSFISTASLSLAGTPHPDEVSMSFHSVTSPNSADQTEFLSFDTVNTTPSTNYLTPAGDQTPSNMDDSFGTMSSSQTEEPSFVIASATAKVEVPSTDPINTASLTDHSPTEFTNFVTGSQDEAPTFKIASAAPATEVPSTDPVSATSLTDHSPTEFTNFVTTGFHDEGLAFEITSAAPPTEVPSTDPISAASLTDHSPTEFTSFVMTSSEAREPKFEITSAAAQFEVPSTDPISAASLPDHSPTEFTSFVIAEAPPSADQAPTDVSLSDGTALDTNGSLIVEPPGEETLMQSGLLDTTDSSSATPLQVASEPSALTLLSSTGTLQNVNSPFTITMSTDGAELSPEGALSIQSGVGDVSVNRSFTSSSSSSSTRVVKTTRTVRQVKVVGGQEIVMDGNVGTPEGDGVVSMVAETDGDGKIIRSISGGEMQSSSSFQSSQQTSVMRETSSGGQLASFTITPDGEVTSNGTMSVTRQMSGEMSSSSSSMTSVSRQVSSQRVASFTSSEMSGEVSSSMIRQMSGGSTSTVTRQVCSSSSSSSLTAASSSELVTSTQKVTTDAASMLQQLDLSDNAFSNQTGGGELTFTLTGDSLLEQTRGSTGMSVVSHSSSSQSLTQSEMSSKVVSSSGQDREGPSAVTVSRSMSSSTSQQQSASMQFMTQSSSDGQQPVAFDLSGLSLGAASGNALVEGEPGTTMEKTMMVSSGPGQMSVGQAVSMQGGGSAVGEMEDGSKISVQWQGTASAKQEHSVFSTEFPSDGSPSQLEGLTGQSSQLAISSPEGDSASEGN